MTNTQSSHPRFGLAVGLLLAAALLSAFAVWFLLFRGREPGGSNNAKTVDHFIDVRQASGIDCVHQSGAQGERFMPETMGGGAGWIDYDTDGLFDLYLVNSNEHPDGGGKGKFRNRLYRNVGDGRFVDVTEEANVGDTQYGTGLAVGDYDNDGRSDIYVSNYGQNVLYHNKGDGTFEDVTETAGVPGEGWSTSTTFLDFDNDGFLDLYVCRYVEYDPTRKCNERGVPTYCSPKVFPGVPDLLYRNRGDGTFEDVSAAAGIAIAGKVDGKSLGVIALDFNDDGFGDIYVACDNVRNLLFRNEGDGTFREVGLLTSVAYSDDGRPQAGMGVDSGDIDLDGRADLVVTNFSDETNALYLSKGPNYFSEASIAFGLGGSSFVPLGFGVLLLDFDLDSDLDLYVANGHVYDNVHLALPGHSFEQTDQLFENLDGGGFRDVSKEKGAWFRRATVSRAVASADYDNDGDDDLIVFNIASQPALLRNDGASGHWIGLHLRGTKTNRDAYGTRVTVTARRGENRFVRVAECRSGRGYAAASDPRIRIGLGKDAVTVEEVSLRWPSGALQSLPAPAIDRYHEVIEPTTMTE